MTRSNCSITWHLLLLTAGCQLVVPASTVSAALAQTPQANPTTPQATATAKPRPIVVKRMPAPTINDDCPTLPDTQVRNSSCSEAAALIERLKEAQAKLRNGEQLYFELLSGAPASDPITKVSPRDAFLQMPFEKPFIIERSKTDNELWQPYKLTYRTAGSDGMIWEVKVVIGYMKPFERVEMLYRPPAPF